MSAGSAVGSAVEAAVELVTKGYHVAPVTIRRNPMTGRKMPVYHGKWAEISTADPDRVREWGERFGPELGFAIDCAASGIAVVDLDVKPEYGVNAPEWWARASLPVSGCVVETPTGGVHIYWRQRPDQVANSQGAIAPGVDVRGHGGHVYAPGSHLAGEPAQAWLAPSGPHGMPAVDELEVMPDAVWAAIPVAHRERRRNEGGFAQGDAKDRWWVQERVAGQWARVAEHEPAVGTGFRAVLRGAAIMHGRAVAAGLLERDEAETALANAVTQCWGEVDDEDGKWIATGLDDGECDPWTVLETGDKPVEGADPTDPAERAAIVESWAIDDLRSRVTGTHKRARASLLVRISPRGSDQ